LINTNPQSGQAVVLVTQDVVDLVAEVSQMKTNLDLSLRHVLLNGLLRRFNRCIDRGNKVRLTNTNTQLGQQPLLVPCNFANLITQMRTVQRELEPSVSPLIRINDRLLNGSDKLIGVKRSKRRE